MTARPRRATVKMVYKGKPYSTVRLEIAPEEANATAEHDVASASDLADLGFNSDVTMQRLMTVRYQVAQKLHACTTPLSDGKSNNRAHDLVDIALLEAAIRATLPDVREACAQVFTTRDSTPWPPTLTPEYGWDALYARAAEGLEDVIPQTLDGAIILVDELIAAIDAATDI